MTNMFYRWLYPTTESSLPDSTIEKEPPVEELPPVEPPDTGPVLICIDGTKKDADVAVEGDFIPFGSDGKCVQYDVFKFQPPADYNKVASDETGIDIYGPATIKKQEKAPKRKRPKKKPTVQKRRKSKRIANKPKRK